jgi:hypothetical protein
MNGSIFDRLRRVQRARISRVLRPLVGAAIMSAVATGASAEWQSGPFAMVCALKETKVVTLITTGRRETCPPTVWATPDWQCCAHDWLAMKGGSVRPSHSTTAS